MKSSIAMLSVFIMAFAFCYQVSALPGPDACCFKYTSRKISQEQVVAFYETSSQCPLPGIIFLTKKGHQRCADPSESWVQKYIKELNF
ncbi:C-C motif chemokine 3-like 1 [Macrotis lagotis]|uniref:C-C motif chemokine 3-like 1 n=1 Tax=Macrotis lagotis TaxID=92651 RepID=UPI003D698FC6